MSNICYDSAGLEETFFDTAVVGNYYLVTNPIVKMYQTRS